MEEIKCNQVAQINSSGYTEMTGRVYDKNGLSPSIRTFAGGNTEVKVLEEPLAYDEQNGYLREDGIVGTLTTDGSSPKHNNRVVEPINWIEETAEFRCPTLTQAMGAGGGQIPMHNYDFRVRKLTEKECFRLQGVKDEDFAKIRQNQSKSSCYHLACDSITTSVLMALFGEMLGVDWKEKVNALTEELQD